MGPPSSAGYHSQQHTPRHSPSHNSSADPNWPRRRASRSYDYDIEDERPRTNAYPVYAGPDGGQGDSEVLISQGRYEETTLTELPKDKSKGKKLFAFATGGSKDRKIKSDRPSSPSPPRRSRDHRGDESLLTAPPMDNTAQSGSGSERERNKEPGWMEKLTSRAHHAQNARLVEKETESHVSSRIGFLCAHATTETEWMEIFPLLDLVSSSDAAAKEAARAIRKEFKYGSVDTQKRAVRVWALLSLNASERFRREVAGKRFLDSVEESVSSSKTPLSVKETMLRVLGVLAWEFKEVEGLGGVTKCWNKVRPSDRRKDGEPLEAELMEFRLPQQQSHVPSRRASQRQPQQQQGAGYAPPSSQLPPPQQQQRWTRNSPRHTMDPPQQQQQNANDVVSNLEAAAESMDSRSNSYQGSDGSSHPPHGVIGYEEDIRRLREECTLAHSNATLLIDTLLQEGLHPETADVVDEFYRKVLHSQDLIASQIPWASAQAERGDAGEILLGDLLEAHGRTSEAIRMVDEARRRSEEEEEERRVLDRSKVEVRLDRSALAQDAGTGELYDVSRGRSGMLGVGASGSRSPSPNATAGVARAQQVISPGSAPRVSRPLPVPRSEPSSDSNSTRSGMFNPHMPPTTSVSSAGTHSREASISSSSQYGSNILSPPLQSGLSTSPVRSLPLTPRLDTELAKGKGEKEEDLETPIVPSEKALGKRRAVSVRYPTPPPTRSEDDGGPPALPNKLVNGMNGIHIS